MAPFKQQKPLMGWMILTVAGMLVVDVALLFSNPDPNTDTLRQVVLLVLTPAFLVWGAIATVNDVSKHDAHNVARIILSITSACSA